MLLAISHDYVGVDYTPELVSACRSAHPGVSILEGDARDLSRFPASSFQLVVFSFNGIDAVAPADRILILSEAHRVLRTGGALLFSTHNRNGPGHGEKLHFGVDRTRDPLKFAGRCATALLHASRTIRNYWRYSKLREDGRGYSIRNASAHDHGILVHYITLESQLRQLESVGFRPHPAVWASSDGRRNLARWQHEGRVVVSPGGSQVNTTDVDVNDEESAEGLAKSASLFASEDRRKARDYASYALGSLRRHRLLALAVFTAIVGGTIGSFFALPRTYHVETRALAQPSSALTVRGDGPGADSLTRAAADTVLRQDNLLALIRETDLLRYTRDHRAPAQRARDAIVTRLRGHEESEADQLDALVRRLEKKLVVWTSDGGNNASGSTLTIAIDWTDATMACRLVDAAQRAFLDARYAREVTALEESIAILRAHTASLKTDIDDSVSRIARMRGTADGPGKEAATEAPPSPAPSRFVALPRAVAPSAPRTDGDLRPVNAEIQAKQHAIDELEDLRRRRLSDLQGRLAEARATFTENHPTIVDLKQSIAALSSESAQVAGLRQELASLRSESEALSARASAAPPPTLTWAPALPSRSTTASPTTPPQEVPADVLRVALDLREDRDPAMVYARGQLRDAMDKYAALRARIQTAQIDLETAQAAFKYRYTVVTPARLPRHSTVPNVPVVTLAAVVAAAFCAFIVAVWANLRRGRLLERWQVERLLGRPIIGEVALPEDLESA